MEKRGIALTGLEKSLKEGKLLNEVTVYCGGDN